MKMVNLMLCRVYHNKKKKSVHKPQPFQIAVCESAVAMRDWGREGSYFRLPLKASLERVTLELRLET